MLLGWLSAHQSQCLARRLGSTGLARAQLRRGCAEAARTLDGESSTACRLGPLELRAPGLLQHERVVTRDLPLALRLGATLAVAALAFQVEQDRLARRGGGNQP